MSSKNAEEEATAAPGGRIKIFPIRSPRRPSNSRRDGLFDGLCGLRGRRRFGPDGGRARVEAGPDGRRAVAGNNAVHVIKKRGRGSGGRTWGEEQNFPNTSDIFFRKFASLPTRPGGAPHHDEDAPISPHSHSRVVTIKVSSDTVPSPVVSPFLLLVFFCVFFPPICAMAFMALIFGDVEAASPSSL